MRWIEKIQNKPTEEKIRTLKIIIGISAVLLIGIWVLLDRLDGRSISVFGALDQLNSKFQEVKTNYGK
jgi:hypothetical protein